MSIFWGSPQVDERRRKRLAADAARARRTRASSARRNSRNGAAQLPFSLSEIIPASPLAHLLILCIGSTIAVGFALLGYYDTFLAGWTGPVIARLFYLGSFPLARWYGMTLLSGASLLCFIILWGRSHSENDLRGSYRLWRSAALFMLFDSVMLSNRGHLLWSKTLLHFWPDKVQGHETLAWVAPAVALGYWVTRRFLSEMRDCWYSWLTIALSAILHLATVADLIDQRIVPATWTPQFLEALRLGSLLLGQVCLFCGVLFHARHVVYVSIEPPSERYYGRGIIGALFAVVFSLLSFGWLRAFLEARKKASRSKASAAAKSRANLRSSREEEPSESKADEEEELESEEQATRPDQNSQRWARSGNRNVRIDPPQEPAEEPNADFNREDMRGMSKKERRRLLQQQREEQNQRGS